jgi:hypothetical protein
MESAAESAVRSVLPSPGPRRWRLTYHLAIVLAVKLVLLALLWNAFIKPHRVTIDAGSMGERIAGAVSSSISSSSSAISTSTSSGDHK